MGKAPRVLQLKPRVKLKQISVKIKILLKSLKQKMQIISTIKIPE